MTQHFVLRGRQEHHSLMLEDLKSHTDDNGKRYYILSVKRTKTGQGILTKKDRKTSPKLFEIDDPRCFLVLLDIFKSKRPANLRDKGPFYLQIIENPRTAQWYKNLPVGENTIGDTVKNTKTNSPLAANEKKMTNHSVRKTAVKKMQRKGLSKSDIIAITGHASEKGLGSYDEGDERQQKTLSNIIDGITPNSRPSQGTANHQSPSVLTAPARRPPFKEISANVLQPRPRYYRAPASYPAFQQFQQHQQALRESYRPISNVQSQHHMYYPPSNIVYRPPVPIQQVFNISNSTVTLLHSTKMSSKMKQNDNVHVPVLSQLTSMLKLDLIIYCTPSYWIDLFYLIGYFYRMYI